MKKFLQQSFTKEIFILFIFTAILIFGIWFRGNFVIWTVDTYLGNANAISRLYNSFFLWKDKFGLGYAWSDQGMIFHYAPLALLQLLGISLHTAQAIVVFILFFLTLFAGWWFGYTFISNNPKKPFGRFVTAFFYAFNPVTLTWIWWRFLSWIYFYPAILIFWIIFYRYFKYSLTASWKMVVKKAIIVGLFSLLFVMAFTSSICFVLWYLTLGIWYLFFFFSYGKQFWKKITVAFLTLGLILFLINCFHIFPQVFFIGEQSKQLTSVATDYKTQLMDASKYSTFMNTLRLMGEHSMYRIYGSEFLYDNTWSIYIRANILPIIFSFVPFLCFGISILYKRTKYVVFYALVFLIAIILVKGLNPPFGEIVTFLSSQKWGLLFRHPYDKFIYFLVITYTFFVGKVFYWIWEKHIVGRIISLIMMIGLCGFLVFPLWTGSVIQGDKTLVHGTKVQIPKDYEQLYVYKNKGVWLQLPLQSIAGDSAYDWKEGAQPNNKSLLDDYINNPVLFGDYSSDSWFFINKKSSEYIKEKNKKAFLLLLSHFNISTIFVNRDVDWKFMKGKLPFENIETITTFLDNLPELEKKESSSYVIYTRREYEDTLFFSTYDENLFQRLSADKENITPDVDISYIKINPIHYRITVEHITKPFYLIFNNNYHKKWQLSFQNKSIPSIAYEGLTNGWYIDPIALNANRETSVVFDLYFQPQNYFNIGILISLLSVIIGIFYLKKKV